MSEDSVAGDQLRAFIERIERMEEEKAAISVDIREIYAEAKGNGFDTVILRRVVKLRKQDANERMEQEAILELYMSALGMIAAPPNDDDDPPSRRRHSDEYRAAPLDMGRASTITEPQPAAHQAAQSQGTNLPSPSPDRREGDDDGQSIQPETAAPGAAPETDAATRGEGSQATLSATYFNSVSFQPPSNADRGESIGSAPALSEAPATGKPGPVSAGPALAPGQVRYEACPPHGMVRHDFQRCFPERWGPQVADLADDIRENGIKRPIIMLGDQLLDGWSRYLIARELKIEYPIKEYEGTDPLLDVIRWNIESRKLTMNERKIIASKLMKLPAAAGRHDEIALLFGLETEGQAI